jgi:hypothetical protein
MDTNRDGVKPHICSPHPNSFESKSELKERRKYMKY